MTLQPKFIVTQVLHPMSQLSSSKVDGSLAAAILHIFAGILQLAAIVKAVAGCVVSCDASNPLASRTSFPFIVLLISVLWQPAVAGGVIGDLGGACDGVSEIQDASTSSAAVDTSDDTSRLENERSKNFLCDGVLRIGDDTWSWSKLQASVQHHVRMIRHEGWSAESRQNRHGQLWDAYNAGAALVKLVASVGSPCTRFKCTSCYIGEVTLRILHLLIMPEKWLRYFISGPKAEVLDTGNHIQALVWDALMRFDLLLFQSTITWLDIVNSGWPVFGAAAVLATLVGGGKPPSIQDPSSLEPDVAPKWDAEEIAFGQDLERILRPQTLEDDKLACMLPDDKHVERWSSLVQGHRLGDGCRGPTVLAQLLLLDMKREVGLASWADNLKTMQSVMAACRNEVINMLGLLCWEWPFFEAMDRLQLPSRVAVRIGPAPVVATAHTVARRIPYTPPPERRCEASICGAGIAATTATAMSQTVDMIVPRSRRPGSFGFVGDTIRVTGEPHCSLVFQNILELILGALPTSVPVHVVDVGGMLGDCCLWSSVRTAGAGRRLRCSMYEPDQLWAQLAAATMHINGIEDQIVVRCMPVLPRGPFSLDYLLLPRAVRAGRVDAIDANASHTPGVAVGAAEVAADDEARVAAAVAVATGEEEVLVVKVHTDARELGVLSGALGLLTMHRLHAVVVKTLEVRDLISGAIRPGASEVSSWLVGQGLERNYTVISCEGDAVILRATPADLAGGSPWSHALRSLTLPVCGKM
eukprot:TRINITY_DN44162_c0_g1_i1.p1 TRINITY_DN44162_c0_g1~~TRINITY_DN44162_c0_g1_i1.p1  ORF type:complete len:755 (-),score=100.29 TRINITY_DN44162_c0_g1_i1:23-2287(-)